MHLCQRPLSCSLSMHPTCRSFLCILPSAGASCLAARAAQQKMSHQHFQAVGLACIASALSPLCRRVVFGGTRSRQVVHRLALFDTAGHLSHVISQSDVIK